MDELKSSIRARFLKTTEGTSEKRCEFWSLKISPRLPRHFNGAINQNEPHQKTHQ